MTTREAWLAVAERHGLTLRAIGGCLRGPCPFHRGANTTSFVISPEKGFYHCFACGESGGGLHRFTQRLVGAPPSSRPAPPPAPPHRLRAGRAVTPLAPLDSTHPYFGERGIHTATARYFGMGYFRGTPPLGGRIITPLHDETGMLVGHLGRAIDDSEPRYWFQRGVERGTLLFNLHRVIGRQDTVVLVEGVFDAAAVHQIGIPNVVASFGCTVSETQRALLRRFRRVFLLFDGDDAGEAASAELEKELGPEAVRIALPKADPCSIKGVLLERAIRSAGA